MSVLDGQPLIIAPRVNRFNETEPCLNFDYCTKEEPAEQERKYAVCIVSGGCLPKINELGLATAYDDVDLFFIIGDVSVSPEALDVSEPIDGSKKLDGFSAYTQDTTTPEPSNSFWFSFGDSGFVEFQDSIPFEDFHAINSGLTIQVDYLFNGADTASDPFVQISNIANSIDLFINESGATNFVFSAANNGNTFTNSSTVVYTPEAAPFATTASGTLTFTLDVLGTQAKVYNNGVLYATATFSTNIAVSSNYQITLGNDDFNLGIGNSMFWYRQLTDADVGTMFENGLRIPYVAE